VVLVASFNFSLSAVHLLESMRNDKLGTISYRADFRIEILYPIADTGR
jgi:hypothetical protein